MSKRRKGFASEKKVKRGVRIVHGNKELSEKAGRSDLCPGGSGRRFKKCCLKKGCFRRRESGPLHLANEKLPVRPRRKNHYPADSTIATTTRTGCASPRSPPLGGLVAFG